MAKAILRDGDVISGAVLAALGVYIVLQARAWDYIGPDGPGPGFFPIWYGIAMTALSLLLVINALRKRQKSQSEPQEESQPFDWRATGRALGTWAAFALSVALMGPLGFIVSFSLLTFFVVVVIFRRPLWVAGVTAVVTALTFHLIFPVALSVPLPTGVLGF